ncbi:MAG: DUF3574 domain-containing protein [Chloroflexota bacterium]|nr:DUF3574 domain-containing protein [Chloroflexota bacterium]MDE2969656.1 DUF3574 domain-containing protein [Chloroflexota bacterium]
MPRAVLLLAAIAVLLAVAACESSESGEAAAVVCPEGTEHWAEYRLYFGRNSGGGEVVSDEEWRIFVRDVVTPNFPEGLTVLDGEGQWQTAMGDVERERSKVLVVLAPLDGDAPGKLATVAEGYKAHFDQESVIQTIDSTCTSFY